MSIYLLQTLEERVTEGYTLARSTFIEKKQDVRKKAKIVKHVGKSNEIILGGGIKKMKLI